MHAHGEPASSEQVYGCGENLFDDAFSSKMRGHVHDQLQPEHVRLQVLYRCRLSISAASASSPEDVSTLVRDETGGPWSSRDVCLSIFSRNVDRCAGLKYHALQYVMGENGQRPRILNGKCIHTVPQTLRSLFPPAACYRPRCIQSYGERQRLHHEVALPCFFGTRLQRHTSSDIDGGIKVSVHELNAFPAVG